MQLRQLWWIALSFVAGMGAAGAQTGYPNKPIRIVAAELKSSGDQIARLAADALAGLKQPVVVENLSDGTASALAAAKAAPDGYTLSTSGNQIWLLPFLQDDAPVSPLRDFSMVVMTTNSPAVLAINPSFKVNSVKDLIDQAKARPGSLRAATATPGSITQLSLELFKYMAGIDFVRVPYKTAVDSLNGIVEGEVQFMFFPANLGAAQIKAGKIKAFAVASARPTALFPGLPTVGASGLPGYESAAFQVVFAPARTPDPIIALLNQEIVRHINRPEVKEKLFAMGLDVVGASPKDSMDMVKSEMDRMGKVIKEAGLKAR